MLPRPVHSDSSIAEEEKCFFQYAFSSCHQFQFLCSILLDVTPLQLVTNAIRVDEYAQRILAGYNTGLDSNRSGRKT